MSDSVGIVSAAGYVPRYRLARKLIGEVHGQQHAPGERSVAAHDEDSLTQAWEAAWAALPALGTARPAALLFASSSPPLLGREAAPTLALTLDLPEAIFAADIGGGSRAGTAALRIGLDVVGAGGRPVLIAAGERRPAAPGSALEQLVGDAGGACLLSSGEGTIAVVEAAHAVARDVLDVWQRPGEAFPRRADAPFLVQEAFVPAVVATVQGLLEASGRRLDEVAQLLIAGPDQRACERAASALKASREQLGETAQGSVGDAGAAAPLLQLALALERAEPGQRLALVGAGGGSADAFLLRVTDRIREGRPRPSASGWMARGKRLATYEKFLKLRGLLGGEPLSAFTSPAIAWREQARLLRLRAARCRRCGERAFPPQRACPACGAKDDFDQVSMARAGRIVTYAKEHLFPSPDPPTVMAVAELEDGLRFYGQVADPEPGGELMGAPVELALRCLHEGGGYPNYFWKLRLRDDGGAGRGGA